MADNVEVMEVDLHGQKLQLPKETAAAIIKARDADKAERRILAERLGALEATAKAAEEAQKKAAEEAELAKLTSKGEYEKALAMEREKYQARQNKLAESVKNSRLEAEIARVEGVLPAAIKDIASQLRSSCEYDLESASLVFKDMAGRPVTDESGKPVAVDAAIKSFLQDRPFYRVPTGQPGSGAAGTGKPTGKIATMTLAEYDAAMKDPHRSQMVAKQIADKQLTIA